MVAPGGRPRHTIVRLSSTLGQGQPEVSPLLGGVNVLATASRGGVGSKWAKDQVLFSMLVKVSNMHKNICVESTYPIGEYKWKPIRFPGL